VLAGKAAPGPDRSRPPSRFGGELPRWLTWMLAALVIGVGAALWLGQRPAQAPQQSAQRGKVIGAKLAQTLSAHTKGVNKVAYSPDGSVLASAGADGRLILWNSATRNAIATLTAHAESVTSVAFAPNGKLFASGSWLGEVILWDATKREPQGEPIAAHEMSVDDIAFSPDSTLMATSSSRDGGKVKVWDVPGGKLRYERNANEGAAYCVAFSPGGATLASGSGKYVSLWNAADGKALVAPFPADGGVVYDIAFSADGKVFATAGTEGVRLWNAATRQPLGPMLEAHGDQVNGVAFNARGDLFASAAHGNTVILWDRNTQQIIGEPLTGHTDYVDAVAFAPDGKQLASAGHDGKVNVWELMFEQH
jgi:WD40 repeat protein